MRTPTALASVVALAVLSVAATSLSAPEATWATGNPVGGAGSGFYLNDSFTGSANRVVQLPAGASPTYVGDLDGDGRDTLMTRSGATFAAYAENRTGSATTRFVYGDPGDVVLVGDWDGDGIDTVGVRRGNTFFLRNSNSSGVADVVLTYGNPSDAVLVGDWNGDGLDTLAVWRTPFFHIRNDLAPGPAEYVVQYGDPGDIVTVGDWNGDRVDTLGIVRGATYYLRDSMTPGAADLTVPYGDAGDIRFVGDWDGDGRDSPGLRRTCVPSAGATCSVPATSAARVLELVNAHRANAALAPVRQDGRLDGIAQSWSTQMAGTPSMTHNPAAGQQIFGFGFRRWGENIAISSSNGEVVMNSWMNSAGHRANILNGSFTHIGIGAQQSIDGRWYWTQMFGG